MIELTEQQIQTLEHPEATPPRGVNPWTKELIVSISGTSSSLGQRLLLNFIFRR